MSSYILTDDHVWFYMILWDPMESYSMLWNPYTYMCIRMCDAYVYIHIYTYVCIPLDISSIFSESIMCYRIASYGIPWKPEEFDLPILICVYAYINTYMYSLYLHYIDIYYCKVPFIMPAHHILSYVILWGPLKSYGIFGIRRNPMHICVYI